MSFLGTQHYREKANDIWLTDYGQDVNALCGHIDHLKEEKQALKNELQRKDEALEEIMHSTGRSKSDCSACDDAYEYARDALTPKQVEEK